MSSYLIDLWEPVPSCRDPAPQTISESQKATATITKQILNKTKTLKTNTSDFPSQLEKKKKKKKKKEKKPAG